MIRRPLIAISGSVAQNIRYGGHVWVFLQYLLGFRRLGFDVLLIDRLEPEMVCTGTELQTLAEILARFGLSRSFTVLDSGGEAVAGIDREEVLSRVARSTFLLNVMGFLDDEQLLDAAPRRVFLDIDPGWPQMWHELGLADILGGHDAFATMGGLVGRDSCRVPTCGLEWIHTRPPVVLEQWHTQPLLERKRSFASIGAWRGPFAPVEFDGDTYGLRVHEFRALSELPRHVATEFDAVLDIDDADGRDAELLRGGGWELLDPDRLTADPESYRGFIRKAGAELMVAKNMYVRSRGGWFSDRSACFLASGKPVLALDTGIGEIYPTGAGLLTFDSLEEATAGAEQILADYEFHARAARAIAEEWFDSDVVLDQLLHEVIA